MRTGSHIALLALGLLAACSSQPDATRREAAAVPAPLGAIRSASITLPPDEQTFGDDPQAETLNGKCLACHSATMVLYQPPLNRKQWTATVDKMREAYRAPIEAGETDAIVSALLAKAPSRQ
ncbi:cytochrome c [Novosphingobium sp. BL-52-GroH]|uniref:cytochrome c n=1 Tax=Novosphingobium sp. BL-52-GroH TaxID=3349877 RepID=UPI00384E1DD0